MNMYDILVALFLGTQAAYNPFPSKVYQVVEYSEGLLGVGELQLVASSAQYETAKNMLHPTSSDSSM